jgi:hypothetical protein
MTALAVVPAPNVLAAHLGDESVLLDLDTKHYFRLNETAAVIWRALEHSPRVEAIIRALVEEFEVTEDEARLSLEQLVDDLRSKGLVLAP